MELILIALLGCGIASLVMPVNDGSDDPSDSKADAQVSDADTTSTDALGDLLAEAEDDAPEGDLLTLSDQITPAEHAPVSVEEGYLDMVPGEPSSFEIGDIAIINEVGESVSENADETPLLDHTTKTDDDTGTGEDISLMPDSEEAISDETSLPDNTIRTDDDVDTGAGEDISLVLDPEEANAEIHFSRFANQVEFRVDIPEDVTGLVHRVDVQVGYNYSASYAGDSQNSSVTRDFTFYVLSPDETVPNIDIEVENIYDLRDYVDFGPNPFEGCQILAAIDLGAIRETDFISINDEGSSDNGESYYVESRVFVSNYAPSSVVLNREVVSIQKVAIEFKGAVEEY